MVKLATSLAAAARRAFAVLPLPVPGRGFCCLCGASVAAFLPYTDDDGRPFRYPPLMAALGLVGSDVRRFSCPRCLSHDRERHLLLYLRSLGFEQRLPQLRILHMAPERNLRRIIAQRRPLRYVQGDLFPASPEIERVDLEQLPFDPASFDLVIANHVLEHVADDAAALREIARVLAPGGQAILQTPYAPVLARTFEDAGIRTPAARLHAYGQADHVRLYGNDIFRRFAAAGLEDTHATHAQALPDIDARRFGVNAAEPLFLFRKPGAEQAA